MRITRGISRIRMKDKKRKEICHWDRSEIQRSIALLIVQAHNAKYVCKKCGRTAEDKSLLCKPVREKGSDGSLSNS
ncbi:hypothetical protein CA13_14690 [Planctomycetes bacterium CA13]|uniref:Uncharacterized protein n=1 Tax=Novipirellula herctigrandis TaxID=2527986 RepID=A0A5C5YZA3_9BACT|nr:hypothetical protein CA13_14690 [Planctomycetes bacterium CA13]